MQIHALELNDFSDNNYTLIGIHSSLEAYKLAYLLNQKLNIQFVKASYSLDFENKNNNASFEIYEFIDTKFNQSWFLISNKYSNQIEGISKGGLFPSNEITTYLISEKKKVDFFIKLEGDFNPDYLARKVGNINTIDQVITAYTINPNTLKSKDFLIF
ncbi:MAG: IPExxxVDY family protein [Polaribacter sp.]|nr:IPExxxVDY family protein [Polaribacter sp.]MDG1810827.1 IPExxxVDY family protein [Polaribacter sp.]MDG1994229.1 IPExxxVDY family protein [Polaribacter sp.]